MNKRKYKAIIIDDEEKARRNLINVLKTHDDIDISAEANSARTAIDKIIAVRPDIIFLDIKMPQKDGFSMLDDLLAMGSRNFEVVFLTAYDEFAIKAFKYAAFDYLLKPVDPDELSETLNKFRLKTNHEISIGITRLKDIFDIGNKLRFTTRTGYAYFYPRQIVYIEAEGSYSVVHNAENKTCMVCRNLKTLEEYIVPKACIFNLAAVNLIIYCLTHY